MGQPETTSFGATIVPTQHYDDKVHPTVQTLPALTPAVSSDSLAASYADRPIPPCSPFYQHPPASHERVAKPTQLSKTSYLDVNVLEKGFTHDDVATPISVNDKNPFCSTVSINANKECTMWPSHQTLVTTKRVEKKNKRSTRFYACAGLRHNWEQLHAKHRLAVRVALAVILIGAMIGLGVGISKAVHGSYYSGSGSSTST